MEMMKSSLAPYIATQIMLGKVDYCQAIAKYPNLKADIDAYLTSKGYDNLIRTDCPVA